MKIYQLPAYQPKKKIKINVKDFLDLRKSYLKSFVSYCLKNGIKKEILSSVIIKAIIKYVALPKKTPL